METLFTFDSQPLLGLLILKASQNLQTHHLPLSSLQNPMKTQSPKNLEDLIFHEVLPRIPTKSLLRLKTVAGHWNAFITSVEFLKLHVRHLPSFNSNSVLTLDNISPSFQFIDYGEGNATKKQSIGCFDWLLSSCKALALTFLLSPLVKSQVDRIHGNGIPRKKFGRRMIGRSDFLLSSCNGLAFLVSPGDVRCRSGFDYVLYNPVLGPDHFVKIPHPDQNPLGGEDLMTAYLSYGFGFGYVSSREDYYIVAINLPRGFNVVVSLYSLRSKEWSYDELTLTPHGVSSLPLLFQKYWTLNTGTLIKETLYWGIKQGNEHRFIFAYDLATFSHSLLPYPPTFGEITEAFFTDFGLCCFDDCLCAWSQDGRNVVEMWMMKEHLYWSGLFRIVVDFPAHNFFGFNKTQHFLVLGDDQMLYLSDLNCNTRLIVKQKMSSVVNYVPSLESVLAITNSEPNDQ